ncbi:MAG TPA: DUF1573 domain-containing protein [Opitutaceae bacterium]|nr:DUF1573 domain-containing protein [Opitutaceae bacterium]
MLSRSLLAVVLSVALASACTAELKWEATEVILDLDSSQAGGEAVFRFVNEGTGPVKIARIAPGCGCTVPVLDKTEFAPGETGTLSARFTTGERRGAYHVPIVVVFDDDTTAELSLVAQIRELVKYFPLNLVWTNGETRASKNVELHWNTTDKVEVTSIRSVNPAFKAELAPDHDWNGALVRISPSGDDVKGVSVVVITTVQGPNRISRTYTLVARAI